MEHASRTRPHRGVSVRPGIVLFIVASALSLAVTTYLTVREAGANAESQNVRAGSDLGTLRTLTEASRGYFAGILSTMSVVAATPALRSFALGNAAQDDALARLFDTVMQTDTDIYQLRYIDASGMERIRLDRTEHGIEATAPGDLQDKSDRGYFIDSMRLKAQEIYVSALDLNVEHGQVEVPWRPTIRIAVRVPSGTPGGELGIVIANVAMQPLLDEYSAIDRVSAGSIVVLGPQGHTLSAQGEEDLWGFMFGRPAALPGAAPDVWSAIERDPTGVYAEPAVVWSHQLITAQSVFRTPGGPDAPDAALWYLMVRHEVARHSLVWLVTEIVVLAIVIGFLARNWSRTAREKSTAQQQLVNAEKLSSLARLVAGIAHELNTPLGSALTVVTTTAEDAAAFQKKIDSGTIRSSEIVGFVGDVRQSSELAHRTIGRAAELVKQFKQISVDQSAHHRREFRLDNYIEEIAGTLAHTFKHSPVELRLNLHSGATIDGYPGPFSQVVMNIVQNALVHGFAEGEAGSVTVSTAMTNDHTVRTTIADTGHGIPKENLRHIFEPFYTTRLGQGGSGLGLHIVHNITTAVLGGSVTVDSDSSGTRFVVTMPLRAPSIERSGDE